MRSAREFRRATLAHTLLTGCFIKTPAYQIVEIAGLAGLDFVVLDAEHGVFDPSQRDQCLMAARAGGTAGLVRLPDHDAGTILSVLDMGAAGVLVPHVMDAETARTVVARTRYRDGERGFSNSPRAGGYGSTAMPDHLASSDESISVWCQIEDRAAIENIAAIAAVPGVDCLFIGRADLALSYGLADLDHPTVQRAIDNVIAAGAAAGVPVGIFLADDGAAPDYARRGVSVFLIGADQSWIRASARALMTRQSTLIQSARI